MLGTTAANLLTFGHTALQTRIEGIATEQGEELRLICITLVFAVVIAQGLKSSDATHRLSRTWFHVIDIIVVYEAKIWDDSG